MPKLVFVWDNFGPLHADRCDAVARRLAGRFQVVGLELAGSSQVYDWNQESGECFTKVTLLKDRSFEQAGGFKLFRVTLKACLAMGRDAQFFMCHYQEAAIFATSVILRLLGRRVYIMGCSKFDTYERQLGKEAIKRLLHLPYQGGIASWKRSSDYMRFMGLDASRVKSPYNCVSLQRVRNLALAEPAPEGVPFKERKFIIVARLVPEKNLSMALSAFSQYAAKTVCPRELHIFGSGPLGEELQEQARSLGVSGLVHLHGFMQTSDVCKAFGSALALLLPSIMEQFGNVVPEALAMGLPIILSDICGARDLLVRSGVNGFVVEPDNPEGMAYFMSLLADDENLWRSMCNASRERADCADADRFAEAVESLLQAAG